MEDLIGMLHLDGSLRPSYAIRPDWGLLDPTQEKKVLSWHHQDESGVRRADRRNRTLLREMTRFTARIDQKFASMPHPS